MRWWMAINPRSMAIDNAGVMGMDFTELPSNTLYVEWREGRGEAEYRDRPGLRENFYEMEIYLPVVPLIQQFMTKLPGITLGQAKKIQNDLIIEFYEYKRQLPYHQNVTAGSFDWDADDKSMTAMSVATFPRLLGTVANGTLINQINSQIVNPGNVLVADFNAGEDRDTSNATNSAGLTANFTTAIDIINVQLQNNNPELYPATNASPGLNGAIGIDSWGFLVGVHTGAAFTPISGGSSNAVPWMPIGNTAPVNLSLPEVAAIMSGIATRRMTLLTTKIAKTNVVNALTTVEDIIAYDVTAGW